MFTFVSIGPGLPPSSLAQCLRPITQRSSASHRRKSRPAQRAKRVRMAFSDRSTEFSLDDSDDSVQRENDPAVPEGLVDWDDWRLTGRSMNVPAIPFPPQEMFLPGERKRLHLFEARYLALFESIVVHYDKRCAHIVVDAARQAMAACGTIVRIHSWHRLDVGVSVEFEAVGRLKMTKFFHSSPFLRGDVEYVEDAVLQTPDQLAAASELEGRFWVAFREVVMLCVKLGEDPIREKVDTATKTIDAVESKDGAVRTPNSNTLGGDNNVFMLSPDAKRELYEQKLKKAATCAVNFEELDFSPDATSTEMVSRRVRALSFAGWDFFPSSIKMRQEALEERNTIARFQIVVFELEQHSRKLAAKLALQNAFS